MELFTVSMKFTMSPMKLFHFDDWKTSWDCLRGQPYTAEWLPIHILFISMVTSQWDCLQGQPYTAHGWPIHIFISINDSSSRDCPWGQPCTADWLPVCIFIATIITQWDCLQGQASDSSAHSFGCLGLRTLKSLSCCIFTLYRYEDVGALHGGTDGMAIIRIILQNAHHLMHAHRWSPATHFLLFLSLNPKLLDNDWQWQWLTATDSDSDQQWLTMTDSN